MKFTAIILILCLLCGCSNTSGIKGSSENAREEYTGPAVNMYAIRENDLNPLLTSSESGRLLLSLAFRPLVTVGQNFDYSYELAETVSSSNDCCVFTVNLKRNILWHDGSPLTSADVSYTISKIFEYAEESPYCDNLANVRDCYADGSHKYVFILETPDSGFPCLLNFPLVKKGSLNGTPVLVGTGEYEVADYKDFSSYTLKSASGHQINVTLLPDNQAAASSFKLGKNDVLKLSSDDNSAYSPDNSRKFVSSNSNRYTYLEVNHESPLLSAPSLRRIIAKILSSENVINDLVPGFAVKADSFVNPSAYFATQNTADYGDIKQALEELGYIPDESGVRIKTSSDRALSLSLLVNSDSPAKVIAAEYIANLLGTYGFKISVTKANFESYKDALVSGNFDLALCETLISNNNDYSFLIGTEKNMNLGGYSSESADNLLASISSCSDKPKKVELLAELQKLFYTDMPHIPLWFSTSKIILDDEFSENITIGGLSDEFSTISSWRTK